LRLQGAPPENIMEPKQKFSVGYYLLLFAGILTLESIFFSEPAVQEISYSRFRDLLEAGSVEKVVIEPDIIYAQTKGPNEAAAANDAPAGEKNDLSLQRKKTPWNLSFGRLNKQRKEELARQFQVVPLKDDALLPELQRLGIDYRGKVESHWLAHFIGNWIVPFVLFFLLWGFLMRRMGRGPGYLNIGKNKAKVYEADRSLKVSFSEVAGVDEAVEEVKEVVAFLKAPERYTRLGAKLPKGILLVGPPGTGKTLLARAVAGEADVPFFNLSGSDFVEMFVGLGAARVRDLFKEAKTRAPCIIFIDELDAVGKNRAQGPFQGANDERENTLNQLLTEMDGFDPQVGIIIMAATNRPEVLDQALLRPGRFDRHILVDRPDLTGRVATFKVHTCDLILEPDVDLHKLAAETPGFAGADIANVCNEAALLAAREGRDRVTQTNFQDAIERVIAGLEKKNKLINPRERKIVAYHESGHAVVGHFTEGADPVQKVSIIPRGIGALGYTLQTPLEDRFLMARSELLGRIRGLLGGRAAEEIVFGEISTGAANDLEKVAHIVRNMLTVYGMSRQAPNLSLVDGNTNPFLGGGPSIPARSEKLEEIIDTETQEIIQTQYAAAKRLLTEKRDRLEAMAAALLEKEKLTAADIATILGGRPEVEAGEPV